MQRISDADASFVYAETSGSHTAVLDASATPGGFDLHRLDLVRQIRPIGLPARGGPAPSVRYMYCSPTASPITGTRAASMIARDPLSYTLPDKFDSLGVCAKLDLDSRKTGCSGAQEAPEGERCAAHP